MKVWLDGRVVEREDATVNVYDHGLLYGDGVFEGIRFYDGVVFRPSQHLERLEEGARAIRLKLPHSLADLAAAMDETIAASGLANGYIRLVVTRGVGTLGLSIKSCARAMAFIIVDRISLYSERLYDVGMPVICSSYQTRHPNSLSQRVKSLNYLPNVLARIEAQDAGVEEALLFNQQGMLAEGTGDNVFLVKSGEALTPSASAGILKGVTRGVVMEICAQLGIPVREPELTRHDVYSADEIFLTGTAAEVIGVSEVDRRPIGPVGTTEARGVGPVTRKIMAAFKEVVARECRRAPVAARA